MIMPSRKALKQTALAKLEKNWNSTLKVNAILASLAIFIELPLRIFSNNELLKQGLISTEIFLAASVGYLIYTFLSIPIFYGIKSFYMNISRGLGGRVADVFEGYKQFFPIAAIIFISGLFIILWSFLLIIPGIIKAISYTQILRVKKDNPEMKALECIDESKSLMEGHKMEYFILQLSFIGWSVLTVFTLGILGFWLLPYMETTYAEFYDKLKEVKYGSNIHVEQIKEIEKEIGEEL
jgi:uncharacterized membrane protein